MRRHHIVTAGLVILGLLAAGCSRPSPSDEGRATASAGRTPPPSAGSTRPTPSASASPANVPTDISGYIQVCRLDAFSYRSPARYAGPGPHLIMVDAWRHPVATPAEWTTQDPSKMVLIACVDWDPGPTELDKCRYGLTPDRPMPPKTLYSTLYTITVKELHTGTVVTTVKIEDTSGTCPSLAPMLGTEITSDNPPPVDQVIAALQPVVTGPAPG
jgi:hypothetical protein